MRGGRMPSISSILIGINEGGFFWFLEKNCESFSKNKCWARNKTLKWIFEKNNTFLQQLNIFVNIFGRETRSFWQQETLDDNLWKRDLLIAANVKGSVSSLPSAALYWTEWTVAEAQIGVPRKAPCTCSVGTNSSTHISTDAQSPPYSPASQPPKPIVFHSFCTYKNPNSSFFPEFCLCFLLKAVWPSCSPRGQHPSPTPNITKMHPRTLHAAGTPGTCTKPSSEQRPGQAAESQYVNSIFPISCLF